MNLSQKFSSDNNCAGAVYIDLDNNTVSSLKTSVRLDSASFDVEIGTTDDPTPFSQIVYTTFDSSVAAEIGSVNPAKYKAWIVTNVYCLVRLDILVCFCVFTR